MRKVSIGPLRKVHGTLRRGIPARVAAPPPPGAAVPADVAGARAPPRSPAVEPKARTAHGADVPKLAPELQQEVTAVRAGDFVEVGPLRIATMHTPGHTPGSTCWHAQEALFAGDTVFVNAGGRKATSSWARA